MAITPRRRFFFFFNDTATTEIYTLSLHDALPISAPEEHLAHKLEGLGAARGSAAQRRFDHCLDTFLGKRAIYRPQPTFMYFPSLPDWEFHDRDAFPWLEEFEASSQEVRREVEGVLRDEQSELVPYIAHADGLPLDQWAQLNRSRRWSAYFLWKEGGRI